MYKRQHVCLVGAGLSFPDSLRLLGNGSGIPSDQRIATFDVVEVGNSDNALFGQDVVADQIGATYLLTPGITRLALSSLKAVTLAYCIKGNRNHLPCHYTWSMTANFNFPTITELAHCIFELVVGQQDGTSPDLRNTTSKNALTGQVAVPHVGQRRTVLGGASPFITSFNHKDHYIVGSPGNVAFGVKITNLGAVAANIGVALEHHVHRYTTDVDSFDPNR